MRTILYTEHGSRLYGLADEHSDYDTYRVVTGLEKRYAKQRVEGDQDATVIHLDRFIEQVGKGVPQAMEALHSRESYVDPGYRALLGNMRPSSYKVYDTYRRTALNFGLGRADFKHRRHALRLALNLRDYMRAERFNPRLNPSQVAFVNRYARYDHPLSYEELLRSLLEHTMEER